MSGLRLDPFRPAFEMCVTTGLLTHISNAGLKGSSRNPDIEALGVTVGVNVRF